MLFVHWKCNCVWSYNIIILFSPVTLAVDVTLKTTPSNGCYQRSLQVFVFLFAIVLCFSVQCPLLEKLDQLLKWYDIVH